MALDPDNIEPLASALMQAIEKQDYTKALTMAAEIRGYCNGVKDTQLDWQAIEEQYKEGVKAPVIAARYGISPRQIYDRAYSQNWLTPQKMKKAVKVTGKKVFYPVCQKCENRFEALHGKALLCNVCKAYQKERKG